MDAILKKMPEISTEQLNSLIFSIDSFNEAWGIKNLQSQHLHMNQAALNFTGIPSNFNIEGKLDHECPVPWAELAPELQDHDRRAEKTGRSVSIIETHFWNNGESIQPYFCEKFPVYNKPIFSCTMCLIDGWKNTILLCHGVGMPMMVWFIAAVNNKPSRCSICCDSVLWHVVYSSIQRRQRLFTAKTAADRSDMYTLNSIFWAIRSEDE